MLKDIEIFKEPLRKLEKEIINSISKLINCINSKKIY